MMRTVFLTILLCASTLGFSLKHVYVFKVQNVTTFEQAKQTIAEFRAILKVKAMSFNDATDEFTLTNDRWELNMADMQEDLAQYGIYLDGTYQYYTIN